MGGSTGYGKAYMVGERGAELFVPDQDGTIIPNDKLGTTNNVNITIMANDTEGFDDLLIKRRSTIINVINDALNSQGREALV
jgi:small-conductance mechanosensitive channel